MVDALPWRTFAPFIDLRPPASFEVSVAIRRGSGSRRVGHTGQKGTGSVVAEQTSIAGGRGIVHAPLERRSRVRIQRRVTLALSAVSVIGCERPAARPNAVAAPAASARVGNPAGGTTAPEPLTFDDDFHSTSNVAGPGGTFAVVASGTTKISGAVTGSFALLDSSVIKPGGRLHIDRKLTGSGGTISMRIDARFVGSDATTDTVRGQWTIISGSGTYVHLRGSGGYDSIVHTATETNSGTGRGHAFRDAGA